MNCSCANFTEILNQYNECKEDATKLESYAAPLLWIGFYIAAASLVCFLAAIADLLHSVRRKNFWFPCKYFTLNATYVTIIAVLTKISIDLNNPMPTDTDQLVKLSSTICLCTIMGNMMPSMGSMNDKKIIMILTALGILVITIFVNIYIQLSTGVIYDSLELEFSLVVHLMFVLFIIMCFSALAVSSTKQYLQVKYGEIHRMSSAEEDLEGNTMNVSTEKLARYVTRYWIMAETGDPQFVMARFATCSSVGLICSLSAVTLVKAEVELSLKVTGSLFDRKGESDYKWSAFIILILQTSGVLVGTIAPIFRWFISVSLKWAIDGAKFHWVNDFTVEEYWIQRLLEFKQYPIALKIKGRRRRKIVHATKTATLNVCIGIQMGIVLFSKIVRLISILVAMPFLWIYNCFHQQVPKICAVEINVSRYVMQIEGERKLPKKILINISNAVKHMINKAKRNKPLKLLQLIEWSSGFTGLVDFDNEELVHLHSKEPPNCWSLVVVTLTSIAVTLPNVKNDDAGRLLSRVKEGMLYISLIEQSLDMDENLVNSKKAAEHVWLGVELYSLWLDNDLRKLKETTTTLKVTLEILADIARSTVLEFLRNVTVESEKDPVNWPLTVVASNSMYRISQTMLLTWRQYGESKMFERVAIMIADIVGACLTNLPRVILMKCYCSSVEEREENVRAAACLLGETEDVMKMIQRHENPGIRPDRAVYIEEWQECVKQQFRSRKFYNCSASSSIGSGNSDIFYPAESGESHQINIQFQ